MTYRQTVLSLARPQTSAPADGHGSSGSAASNMQTKQTKKGRVDVNSSRLCVCVSLLVDDGFSGDGRETFVKDWVCPKILSFS